MTPLLELAVKATVALGLGLLAAWIARRSRAAVRHSIWCAAFAVLAALPAASRFGPRVGIPVQVASPIPAAVIVEHAGAAQSARIVPPPPSQEPLPVALIVWLGGMAMFLLPVAAGLWQVRRLRRLAVAWAQGQEAANELGGERVRVLVHPELAAPMTCGLMRPAVVFGVDARGWTAEELRRALVHEMEHVRRSDWAIHAAARAVCALYWFHPLVWVAWRKLALEAERACDDAVLRRSEATAYADQLVALARRMSAGGRPPLVAMANRAQLTERVRAVLDVRLRRGRAGRWAVAAACAGALAVTAGIGPLRMVASPAPVQVDAAPSGNVVARFNSVTRLIMEQVKVTDANGRNVEGLTAKDFRVREDGHEYTISVFEVNDEYYLLGYYTANNTADGAFRKIQVTAERNDVKLDYRAGYHERAMGPSAEPAIAPAASFTPPLLLHKVEPAYSDEARRAKYQGTVRLQLEVDASGRVGSNVRVVRTLGLQLDEEALDAVKQWRFRPAFQNGSPVPSMVEVAVSFRLL